MATYWENSCSFGLRYVSWYKYLIVSLVFSHLGFWSRNLFLIAPFPDLCLLVPFYSFTCITQPAIFFSNKHIYILDSFLTNKAFSDHCLRVPFHPPFDSSSLTNEKDHHYFLNSADVCW